MIGLFKLNMRINKIIKNSVLYFFIGCLLSCAYLSFPHSDWKSFQHKTRGLSQRFDIILPPEETLMLKIWGSTIPRDVALNGRLLTHLFYRDRGRIKELHFAIKREEVRSGLNTFTFSGRDKFSLLLKNYLFNGDGFAAIFLKPDEPQDVKATARAIIFITLGIILLGHLYSLLCQRICSATPSDFWLAFLFSYVPYFFVALLLKLLAIFTSVVIWSDPFYFFEVFLGYSVFSQAIFCFLLAKNRWEQHTLPKFIKPQEGVTEIDRSISNRFILWYLKQPFGDKCLFWFIGLISISAISLSVSLDALAELSGSLAYFFLVFGVTSRIIRSKQNQKN